MKNQHEIGQTLNTFPLPSSVFLKFSSPSPFAHPPATTISSFSPCWNKFDSNLASTPSPQKDSLIHTISHFNSSAVYSLYFSAFQQKMKTGQNLELRVESSHPKWAGKSFLFFSPHAFLNFFRCYKNKQMTQLEPPCTSSHLLTGVNETKTVWANNLKYARDILIGGFVKHLFWPKVGSRLLLPK